MFGWLKKLYVSTTPEVPEAPQLNPVERMLSTHSGDYARMAPPAPIGERLQQLAAQRPQAPAPVVNEDGTVAAMDDAEWQGDTIKGYDRGQPNISHELANWYASQGFLGHQLAALVAQHWLVMKVCAMPGRDAIRNGFTITTVDGDELPQDQLQMLKRADKAYRLNKNLMEFVRFGRVFGIRICLFKVDYGGGTADVDAYEKPFNILGVRKGCYKGMVQVDPYWCSPMLDGAASSQPDSMHFYEPTWWQINGKRYHRSHLVIFRNSDVADILKPNYLYGGVPVPQLIMERIYGAERTTNEAPLLALTKRTMVYKTDVAEAISKFDKFQLKMEWMQKMWNNFGSRVIGTDDEVSQIETSLADLDAVIMTQYQLVAAAGGVPSTKLLGTAPKGFNATGEFDESSYHEELESLQTHDLTPLVERHHMLCLANAGVTNVSTTIAWESLDSPTAKEAAETEKVKAETDKLLVEAAAIDGNDVRVRIANSKDSGYSGLAVGEAVNLPEAENPAAVAPPPAPIAPPVPAVEAKPLHT